LKLKILQYLYYSKYKNFLITKSSFQSKNFNHKAETTHIIKPIKPHVKQYRKKLQDSKIQSQNSIIKTNPQKEQEYLLKKQTHKNTQQNAKTKSTKISKK